MTNWNPVVDSLAHDSEMVDDRTLCKSMALSAVLLAPMAT